MVNQKIVGYLEEGRRRGFGIPLLKKKLLEGGFRERDVDGAISFINAVPPAPPKKPIVQNVVNKPVWKDNKLATKKIEASPVVKKIEANPVVKKPVVQQKISTMKQETIVKQRPMIGVGKLGVFGKMGKAIAHPIELFEKTKGEGVWPALKFLLVISLWPFLVLSILFMLMLGLIVGLFVDFLNSIPGAEMTWAVTFLGGLGFAYFIVIFAIWFFVAVPIFSFVGAGIFHLIVKLYGGHGRYSDTYRAIIYSMTPQTLFFFIPIIFLWSFILSLFGISINHSISKVRAFFALVTIPLIVLIISLVLTIIGLSMGLESPTLSPPLSGSSGTTWIITTIIVIATVGAVIAINSGKEKVVMKKFKIGKGKKKVKKVVKKKVKRRRK
ncbi:MAG: Yip1 family protein [archaeon]